MGSFSKSALHFIRGVWGAIIAAFCAVQDPLDVFKSAGVIKRETEWPLLDEKMMKYLFVVVAFVWMFIWFHKARMRFEDNVAKYDMPLHIACRWIARDSQWAANYCWPDDQWPSRVHDELLSKWCASSFNMTGMERGVGFHRFVPPAMRDDGMFDAAQLSFQEPPTKIWSKGTMRDGGLWLFDYILLDEKDVKRLWPKKSLLARLFSKSPIQRIGDYKGLFIQQDRHYLDNSDKLPLDVRAEYAKRQSKSALRPSTGNDGRREIA